LLPPSETCIMLNIRETITLQPPVSSSIQMFCRSIPVPQMILKLVSVYYSVESIKSSLCVFKCYSQDEQTMTLQLN
jgi:hypothetical protein